MTKNVAAVVCFGLMGATSAVGQVPLESLEPEVSYSAYRSFSDGGIGMQGAYHYAPGKHRTEIEINGQSMTAIIREDLEVLWSLAPAQGSMRFYMEFSTQSEEARNGNALVGTEVTQSRLLGSEKIGEYRTNKYEVTVSEPEGEVFTGTVWVTDEKIPVRMEMTDPSGSRLVMEQTDIEIGPQPEALFEVPEGYAKLDLGGLGAAFGNISEQIGASSRAGGAQHADRERNDGGFTREAAEHATQAAKQGVLYGIGQGVHDTVGSRVRGLFKRGK